MANIVFEETNNQLESAVSFSQHVFNGTRLITLIGELHNKSFKCNAPSLSISSYCKKAVQRNPNCRVILEYCNGNEKIKSDDPSRMGSKSIRMTFKCLDKIGKKNQIIPLDYRPYFLTRRGQNDLYGSGWKSYKTHDKIRQFFIVPFLTSVESPKIFNLNSISPNVSVYLKLYFDEMVSFFNSIDKQIAEKQPLYNIRANLLDAWKCVADFFIIRDIFEKDNNIDEYIIIVGEAHRENINKIFNKIPDNLLKTLGEPQKGKTEGNCVKLFQSYRF